MEDAEVVLGQAMAGAPEKNPPLDFSQVTPSQFGISAESFIPSSRNKDKSRLSQLKARRRSTVGVRGSPETNSLIRYMAQQKCRTPPSLPPSPFNACGFSTLRQKMASFQSLLEIDEVPKAELLPGVERKEVSDESSAMTAKENMDPQVCLVSATPPSCKKPRMECVQVSPPFLMLSSPPALCVPRWHLGDAVKPVCPELDYAICESPLSCSAAEPRGSGPEQLPPAEAQQACSAGPTQPDSNGLHLPDEPKAPCSGPLMFLSPPSEHPTCEVMGAADAQLSTKKRVRFGAPLTPEFFDKTLPPSTPLQKGGTPARLTASAGPRLRPLLKTPRRSPPPFPQPDFSSPSKTGTAPAEVQFDLVEPNKEDDECPQVTLLDVMEDSGQSALGTADVAPAQIASCQPQPEMIPAVLLQDPLAGTRSELESTSATEEPPTDNAPVRSRGRKRKQMSESLTTRKRASRTAAVCASQKIKGSSRKKHWGSKEVDRSLYGKRDYASKNPTLSPISEAVLSASNSPALQPGHSRDQPSGEMETSTIEVPDATPGPRDSDLTAGVVIAAAMWRKRFCLRSKGPVKDHSDDMAGGKLEEEGPLAGLDQQDSTGGGTRSGIDYMVPTEMEPADGIDRALSSSPTPSSGLSVPPLEEATQVNSDPHKDGVDWHMQQECGEVGANSDTAAPPQVHGGPRESGVDKVMNRGRKRKGRGGNRVRRSCRGQDSLAHVLVEEQMPAQQVPGPLVSGACGEMRREDGVVMGFPSADSSEVSQGADSTDQVLPWQLPDFSIEDILQRPSRGRRSVRRSLRNQANVDPSESGLAWVPDTSPDPSVNKSLHRGSKRWTRPTLPEEASL